MRPRCSGLLRFVVLWLLLCAHATEVTALDPAPAPELAAAATSTSASASTATSEPARSAHRVLLLGNSYTRFNGLATLLRRLAASAGIAMQTEAIAEPGATLRRHFLDRETRRRVQGGRFTHVVLQDHSLRPIDRPAEFADYTDRFARLAVAAGARVVLYETWARHPSASLYAEHSELRSAAQMTSRLDAAYRQLAARHAGALAPVGRAFQAALTLHPQLELYRADGTHPSWGGSYLAACVLLGALTGHDPRDATYVPWELPEPAARALRDVAAQVLAVDTAQTLAAE